MTILIDRPPATLDPRMTLDAPGQRIGELLFRGLTRMDSNLTPQPDLAEKWEVLEGGKKWKFTLRPGLTDQAGRPITAAGLAYCIDNYRKGPRPSPLSGSFTTWTHTTSDDQSITIELSHPDPYLAANLSLLRYYTAGEPARICAPPGPGDVLVGSGHYKIPNARTESLEPQTALTLQAWPPGSRRDLRLEFVMEENTKALKVLRGEIDVAQNALSLTKIRWFEREKGDQYRVLSREGASVSYLAFNLRDSVLAKLQVRQALAHAIDRGSFIRYKMVGFGRIADSLLSPFLAESIPSDPAHLPRVSYDPALSEKLLDQAGYPRGKDGVRLRLSYKSTPVRDGFEMALAFREMWRKIGVEITIDVVEPAVFLASIRKGRFQLYSSRWIGVSDGSILRRTLHSKSKDNRVAYSNTEVDRLLDQAGTETQLTPRAEILRGIQIKMLEDLPYFPLWSWDTSAVIRKDLAGLNADQVSASGSLMPLTLLH